MHACTAFFCLFCVSTTRSSAREQSLRTDFPGVPRLKVIEAFLLLLVLAFLPATQAWAQTTYPVTDSFSGSGALSANWTNTTATGPGYVALAQNSGTVGLSVSGQQGLAIYTGTTFANDQYAQATFVNHLAGGGATGVCVRMNAAGDGVCYLADWGRIYAMVDGAISYTIAAACPVPSSGDTIQIIAIGGSYTCNDVTAGTSSSGSDTNYSLGSPGILIDQTISTAYALSHFQADCSPSCSLFSGPAAAAYPLTDSFSGSGALSSNWTSTLNNGYVALTQNSGTAGVSVSGQAGLAIYMGATFSDDQYAQAVFVNQNSSNSATGVCVRMDSSGTGVCYLAGDGAIYALDEGAGVDGIASCPIPSVGDTIRLSVVGAVYTCEDVSTGASGTGTYWANIAGHPAILVDQRQSSVYVLAQFQADCIPSCATYAVPPAIITLGSFSTTATNPGFNNTATTFVPGSSAVNNGSTATYNLSPGTGWHSPLNSSSYVSYDPGTGPLGSVVAPNGDYYYTTTFTIGSNVSLTSTSGTLAVLADDTVAVYLNGSLIQPSAGPIGGYNSYSHCSNVVPNCATPITFNLTGLVTGQNVLTFDVKQVVLASEGLDYWGTIALSGISVAVTPSNVALYAAQTEQFAANVTGASNTAVTWTISPAGVGSVDSTGLYTAPSSITSQQTVTVTATSQADSTKSASAAVTLEPPVVVSVSPATATLAGGQTQQFAATVMNSGNTAVTWTINPAGTGTVSAAGLYTAPATIGAQQTVTITATSQADATMSASSTINLQPPCVFNGYSYGRSIVIDHTKVPNTDQTNFPFLFSTVDQAFKTTSNGGHVTNSNGYDIIFTSDAAGMNRLPFEQESYSSSTGAVIYWINVPLVSHISDTVFYVWYGNSNITSDQSNKTVVWDNNYIGVWHFPNGTILSASDSTANGNNGTIFGASATAGKIYGGANFNGNTNYIGVGSNISTVQMNTVSFWAYINTLNGAQEMVSHSGNGVGIELLVFSNSVCAYVMGNSQSYICSTSGVNLSGWNHIALTQGGPNSPMALYINGQIVGTNTTPSSIANPPNLDFGVWANSSGRYFNGSLDEIRISSAVRSSDWIAAEYNNQSSPSAFYSVGPESEGLLVSPATVNLYASQGQQFTAQGPACASNFVWSLPPNAPGTLSQNGLFSAPQTITAEQTVLITATSTSDPTKTGSAAVTLTPALNPALTLAAAVQPPYVTGASQQFVATLKNQDGTPLAYFSVSFIVNGANNTSGSATTDGNGIATFAYTGASSGSDTIQASANAAGGQVTSNKVFATWIVPSDPISTTTVLGRFFPLTNCCWFNASPASTPVFEQIFPTINFDPPSGAIPGNTTVGTGTHPFTDVTLDKNGNFSGTIVAQGNGYQAGSGPLTGFQASFTGSFIVANGGDMVIPIYVDNSFILGIGGGATRVSGPIDGAPPITPFGQYPVMGALSTSIGGASITVHFPGPGTYPYELDYVEDGAGLQSIMMMSGNTAGNGFAPGVPSGGTLTLSPSSVQAQPVGGNQLFTITATDAAGNSVPNLSVGLVISLNDTQELSATTNSNGAATFTYVNTNPGTDQVQAVAIIAGMVTYSNIVNVPWTSAPSTPPINNNGDGSTVSISVTSQNTVILPNKLQLSATVTDSALQSGGTIALTWSEVSGPGTVTFSSPNAASTTASFTQPGGYVLKLGATDPDASDAVTFNVTVDPEPGTSQGWIGSPNNGSTVSGIVPITVASGETLQSGTLTFYPANNPQTVTVLNANTTGSGQIGKLDTTTLANGQYWITLQATDTGGNASYNLALVTVVGNYKPGRVTSTVTDLVVPAKGLAIQIQRTYDSLNAGRSSDFGYGWNLGTNVDLSVNPLGSVTFTLGGQRKTFYLTPQYEGFLPYYVPAFTPEPGMHGTLVNAGTGCTDFFDFLLPNSSLWTCVGGGIWSPPAYVYTDPSGTAYTMTASGQLQSIVDKAGNALTITPNGITSSTGLAVPFERDSKGRITKITDPHGNQYLYGYLDPDGNDDGNLQTVTYPNTAQPSTYMYVPGTHLYESGTDFRNNPLPQTTYYASTDTDAHGNSLSGRLESVKDAVGETTTYTYDVSTNTTTLTYPPDGSGNVGTATRVYDNMGDLLSSTDPLGHTTTNTYDANQNLLSTTDPLNHIICYTYDSNGNRTSVTLPQTGPTCSSTKSTTAYNQYSEPTQTTDELGNIRTFNYDVDFNPQSVTDGVGTLSAFIFNNDGTLQAGTIGYDISANPSKASQFTYDSNGNMASRTDALGRATSYTYDSLGHKITMIQPLPNTNTSTATATTTYTYDALGNLTQTAAPLGRTTGSTYDGNGNKISDTDPLGHITIYQYDALNRLTTTTFPTQQSTTTTRTYDFRNNVVDETDQAGYITHHVYDLAGRLTSLTKAYGTANASTTTYAYYNDGRKQSETDALGHTTTYTYDAAGRLTAIAGVKGNVSYGYDAVGNRTSSTDGDGNTTQYQYDARKRLVKTIYPDTTSVTNGYDGPGNLTKVTDQAGNVVQYTFDSANQLQSVIQLNSPNSSNNTTAYGYDNDGNLTNLTDANGHSTANAYDLLYNLTNKTLPDGSSTETRTYDTAGNLLSLQHFNGKTTTYTYDPLDRLLTRTPDSSYSEPVVSFTYTATGKRNSMTDASGTTTYTYDTLDRLTAKTTPEGTLNYTYDAASDVASMSSSNANGVSVGYTYDSLNRLSTVVDNHLIGQNTTTYTYDTASNVATATYPNNLQSTFHYDQLNRLTALTTPNSGYLYQLGPTGNRTNATELTGRTLTWSFDGIYRLTSETISRDPAGKNGAVGYGLDPVGNRLSANSTLSGVSSGSYGYSLNDLLSIETYDSNGNTLTTGGKVFTYDSENRLKSMNGGAITLLYDGDGNRVAKTASGVTTRYLVDDLNPTGYAQVMEEIVNGAVKREYTYGLQRISQDQIVNNAWTPSFYGYDGMDSIRMLTSTNGTVTDTYSYDAFGNLLNSTGTTPNNYLYRGEQYDPDLGLYYLRARYYNPTTGRFMSRDPKEFGPLESKHKPANPNRFHKYLYVGGNPVMYADPTGYAAEAEDAVVISLTPALLGLGEEVSITGSLTVSSSGEATVVIDYVEGNITSPFRFLQALITLAQDNGGKALVILTTFANERLQNIAIERYGFVEYGGRDVWYSPF
jgi:RHS repeat-associated protein